MWGWAGRAPKSLLAQAFQDSKCWDMDCVASKQELVWVPWHRDWGSTLNSLAAGPSSLPHFVSTSLHAALCARNSGGHKEMRSLCLGTIVRRESRRAWQIRSLRWGVPRSQWTASLGTTQCFSFHSQQLEWDQQGLSKCFSI